MLDFYTKEYPVRIGFIFSGNSDVIDILNYGIGEFKNEEMYMLRFLSKFSHQTTIKEAEYMLKYYCDKCDLNKITNETRKLAQKFTAKHSLNSIHFLLNGRILDINLNSIIENQLLFEIYLEKRQIMVKSNDGTLKLPFNNTFEYLKHEKPEKIIYKDNLLEENELSEHIKFGYIFEMNSLPKYITFTAILTENDEKIL